MVLFHLLSVCNGDLSLLAGKVGLSFQSVCQDMEPLTTRDIPVLESMFYIHDSHIISVSQTTKSLLNIKL